MRRVREIARRIARFASFYFPSSGILPESVCLGHSQLFQRPTLHSADRDARPPPPMSWRPPPGVVALAVMVVGGGGIVSWVHESQKRERQVRRGSSHQPFAADLSCAFSVRARRPCGKLCIATSRRSADDSGR